MIEQYREWHDAMAHQQIDINAEPNRAMPFSIFSAKDMIGDRVCRFVDRRAFIPMPRAYRDAVAVRHVVAIQLHAIALIFGDKGNVWHRYAVGAAASLHDGMQFCISRALASPIE